MSEENDAKLGPADPSPEAQPEADPTPTPEDAHSSPEPQKGDGTSESVPFHRHPRWQELVNEKNELKRQLADLHSKMGGDSQIKEDPVEKTVKRYVQAGMKEDAARLIAQGQAELNREVIRQEVEPLRKENLQTQNQIMFARFAESHKDFEEIAPKMDDIFRGMSPEEQAWVSGNPRGLEYLYKEAKGSDIEKISKTSFEKGVQEGYRKKQDKTAIAPSTGASTGTPKGNYSEKDIAEMSLEEYAKARKEILASRGVR